MASFEKAVELGADGIELDVHLSADGRLMVIHDDTVDRTTDGSGSVHGMTFEELRSLDASKGKPGFSGVRVPTLEEVYRLLQPTRLAVNVELKENAWDGGFLVIPRVLELEEKFRMTGRVFYSSFNHYLLREMKSRSEEIPVGLLYSAALVDVWDYAAAVPADAIHPHYNILLRDRELVPRCHAAGIAIRPWTVDDEASLSAMYGAGVDAVITNDPELALRLRR